MARLVPAEDEEREKVGPYAVWAEMDELAREIGLYWTGDASAVDLEQRERGSALATVVTPEEALALR